SLIGLNASYLVGEGARSWVSTLFALPGILLFTPILYLVFVLMTLDLAGALITFAALSSTLIYPLFCRMPRDHGHR
ncbi:hypothetical protein K0U00_15940, partial [Paenibacillus sepulcri]|nr:hypothetical protein [Paenibacillus sepulcri]